MRQTDRRCRYKWSLMSKGTDEVKGDVVCVIERWNRNGGGGRGGVHCKSQEI